MAYVVFETSSCPINTTALERVVVTLMLDKDWFTKVWNAVLVPMSWIAEMGIESLENDGVGT